MFSNDQNIETIAQLIEKAKQYYGLKVEYTKLDIIEKIVKLVTAICLTMVFAIILLMIIIYLSFAAAHALEPSMGLPVAFLIVSCAHLFIFLLLFTFRKQWIERPLVKLFATLLMGN